MNCNLHRPPRGFGLFNGVSALPIGAAATASILLNNDGSNISDSIAAQAKELKLAMVELLRSFFGNTSARSTHVHVHPLGFEEIEAIVTASVSMVLTSRLVPEMHQKEIS